MYDPLMNNNAEHHLNVTGVLKEYVKKLEIVVRSPLAPVVAAIIYAAYMLKISFYCNSNDIPFFDFIGATGVYVAIFVIIAALFISVFVSYYFVPIHVRNEAVSKLHTNKWLAASLASLPGITAYTMVVSIVVKAPQKYNVISGISLAILFIVTILPLIYLFHKGKKAKDLYPMLFASNIFSSTQCVMTGFSITSIISKYKFYQEAKIDTVYGLVIIFLIFTFFPIVAQLFLNWAAGKNSFRQIIVASASVVLILTVSLFDWTTTRILKFLNLGGDVRVELIFRPDSRQAGIDAGLWNTSSPGLSQPTTVILRFQGNAYAFVYLEPPEKLEKSEKKPNILAVNLRDISIIRTCENQQSHAPCQNGT